MPVRGDTNAQAAPTVADQCCRDAFRQVSARVVCGTGQRDAYMLLSDAVPGADDGLANVQLVF